MNCNPSCSSNGNAGADARKAAMLVQNYANAAEFAQNGMAVVHAMLDVAHAQVHGMVAAVAHQCGKAAALAHITTLGRCLLLRGRAMGARRNGKLRQRHERICSHHRGRLPHLPRPHPIQLLLDAVVEVQIILLSHGEGETPLEEDER
ncbi:hypothetical protein QYE76_056200 [Lolium multiflorum]|uniref:Uncharacterized protein n=1 Tax=Lolium multiflorum TaxID=4521 RepID=A0AAD8T162_LOLMU|nr:hypothetical protein QYE76_056200 [Lolium multiflorum]